MTSERLYTPWRLKYITANNSKEPGGCVFCNALTEETDHDRKNMILYRGQNTFAIMNIFPYNPGHVMVLPKQHVSALNELSYSVQCELIGLASYFTKILAELMHPDGFNMGINQGKVAGAGIDTHLHMHLVPRWSGDSNFIAVMGQTRVLPEEVPDTYNKIVAAMQASPPPVR